MSNVFGTSRKLLEVPGEKGLTSEQVEKQMLSTGAYADLCEAAAAGNITTLDRGKYRGALGLPSLVPPATEKICEIELPATEAFAIDSFFAWDNPDVKFGYIDASLKDLAESGIVPAEGPRTLSCHRLARVAKEKELLAVALKETTPADLKQLLLKQARGQKGKLLTNGSANLFFIGGRLVSMYCNDGGWDVNAFSVESPRRWHDGHLVFSRN